VLAGRSRDRKQAAADSDHRGRRGRGGAAERDRVAPRRAQEEEELGDRRSRHLRESSSRRRRQATNVAITVANTPKCASTIKAIVVEPTAAVSPAIGRLAREQDRSRISLTIVVALNAQLLPTR